MRPENDEDITRSYKGLRQRAVRTTDPGREVPLTKPGVPAPSPGGGSKGSADDDDGGTIDGGTINCPGGWYAEEAKGPWLDDHWLLFLLVALPVLAVYRLGPSSARALDVKKPPSSKEAVLHVQLLLVTLGCTFNCWCFDRHVAHTPRHGQRLRR